MAKRTTQSIREYVKARSLRDNSKLTQSPTYQRTASADGAIISGADLARAKEFVDQIPDQVARSRVMAMFSSMSKYTALEMILAENGELSQRFPEQVARIAEAATEVDMSAEGGSSITT